MTALRARNRLAVEWLSRQAPVPPALHHDPFAADLPRFLRNDLTRGARRTVSAHLETCEGCSNYLATLREEDVRLSSKGLATQTLAALLIGSASIPLLPVLAEGGRHTAALVSQPLIFDAAADVGSRGALSAALASPKVWVAATFLPAAVTAGLVVALHNPTPQEAVSRTDSPAEHSDPTPTTAPDRHRDPVESDENPEGPENTDDPAPAEPETPSPRPSEQLPPPATPEQPQEAPPTSTPAEPLGYTLQSGGPAPVLSGSATPHTTIRVVIDDAATLTTRVDDAGTWSLSLDVPSLPAGTHRAMIHELIDGTPTRSISLSYTTPESRRP